MMSQCKAANLVRREDLWMFSCEIGSCHFPADHNEHTFYMCERDVKRHAWINQTKMHNKLELKTTKHPCYFSGAVLHPARTHFLQYCWNNQHKFPWHAELFGQNCVPGCEPLAKVAVLAADASGQTVGAQSHWWNRNIQGRSMHRHPLRSYA